MRLVVDANIIFSALYDMDSTAGRLLYLAIDCDVQLFSTEHIKNEMRRILVAKLGYSEDDIDGLIAALPVEWVESELYAEALEPARRAIHDEADASLLACASVMVCDAVTGDKRVLASKFWNVKVRRLREFKSPK